MSFLFSPSQVTQHNVKKISFDDFIMNHINNWKKVFKKQFNFVCSQIAFPVAGGMHRHALPLKNKNDEPFQKLFVF